MQEADTRNSRSPAKRILVAEDDPTIRNLSVRALVQSGFDVDSVPDGARAWMALDSRRYDLLITDNLMPHFSGLELIERIHHTRMDLLVIMVSGDIPEREFHDRAWLRPAAVLRKPFELAQLIGVARRVLGLEPAGRPRDAAAFTG